MTLNTTPDWRRAVLAMVFAGAGMALTVLAVWQVWIVWEGPWPREAWQARLNIMGASLYASQALLGIVLIGLSMTVALRQVSGKFMGGEFSATGGTDAPISTVTTTVQTGSS